MLQLYPLPFLGSHCFLGTTGFAVALIYHCCSAIWKLGKQWKKCKTNCFSSHYSDVFVWDALECALIDHMGRDKPDAWTCVMGRDRSPRAQHGNVALGGDTSPGFGAANTTQLSNLACLVWLVGNHRSPWLAPVAMWGHGAGQAAKGPKGTSKSHLLHRRWVVNAKAREAALTGKHLRNTRLPISCRSIIHIAKLSRFWLFWILPLKHPTSDWVAQPPPCVLIFILLFSTHTSTAGHCLTESPVPVGWLWPFFSENIW